YPVPGSSSAFPVPPARAAEQKFPPPRESCSVPAERPGCRFPEECRALTLWFHLSISVMYHRNSHKAVHFPEIPPVPAAVQKFPGSRNGNRARLLLRGALGGMCMKWTGGGRYRF